jgi:hypothetical protein
MKTTSRPRLAVLVFAALALPALTCGVAPALRDLTLRMQRVESYLAHVNLPALLVDAHGNVVGPVLDYNRLFLYSSVDRFVRKPWDAAPAPSGERAQDAFTTVLYTPPGEAPLVIEANQDELLTLVHERPEEFLFESPDCTGTPWVRRHIYYGERPSVLRQAWIAPPGRTLYVADFEATEERVSIHSRLYVAGFQEQPYPGLGIGTHSPCEAHRDYTWGRERFERWTRMRPVADLDALFTPPFRLIAQGPMTP